MEVHGESLERRSSYAPLLEHEDKKPSEAVLGTSRRASSSTMSRVRPGLDLQSATPTAYSLPADDPPGDELLPLRRAKRRRLAPHRPLSCCEKLSRMLRSCGVWCGVMAHAPFEERYVHLGGVNYPERFPKNVVRNQKYSVVTFLPRCLYEQFKYFFNLYFLLVAVSQFYPPLQVGFLFTYVAPLVFVIAVSLLKEAYDDFQRFVRDRSMNSALYEVVLDGGRREQRPSSSLDVGTVLSLRQNQRVPADCVLLSSAEKDGCFVRTDQLDGETDWKLRHPIPGFEPGDFAGARVWVEEPREDIYEFVGRFLREGEELDKEQGTPLTLENTLWQNTVLATGSCFAVVVYTGRETRACLNASQPSTKRGLIDAELNYLAKVLFILTLVMAVALVGLQRFAGQWYISIFRFTLLFSSIIPISLRVNTDLAKAVYSVFIALDGKGPFAPTPEELAARDVPRMTHDEEILKITKMPGVAVRNTNLPEELGRIGYLFTDKTGTLTMNDMIFRKMFTGSGRRQTPSGWHHTEVGLMGCVMREYADRGQSVHFSEGGGDHEEAGVREDADAVQKDELVRAVVAIAVTHNVTPVVDPETGARQYQASSPDEVALVQFSESVGCVLVQRDRRCMTVSVEGKEEKLQAFTVAAPSGEWDQVGWVVDEHLRIASVTPESRAAEAGLGIGDRIVRVEGERVASREELALALADKASVTVNVMAPSQRCKQVYTILNEFPFTSESKRMGIVLRNETTGDITFFMKGADTKMIDIVRPVPWLDEQCKDLAREGLRTLVYGARNMSEKEYETFQERYHRAKLDTEDPRGQINLVRGDIERGLEFVGLTGVEDKLQEKVADTLEGLRAAGIKVWMLTGDKMETAICIARSTRLVSRGGLIFPIDCRGSRFDFVWDVSHSWLPQDRPVSGPEDAKDFLRCFRRFRESQHSGAAMVIDGATLVHLLSVEEMLYDEAGAAASVIVARCSPEQKAFVVNTIRRNLPKRSKVRTAAIGDGGNDVSMIYAADVGLGIEGKEGKHASLAADFSLTQFYHCFRLMIWHGRNSYRRSARLSQFVIHRGLIISVIQAIFSALFDYMSVPIYTGWMLVGYSTVYTMFPVFAIVLDEDVPAAGVMEFPELYAELKKSRALNFRTFLQWVLKAVYQGGAIMLMAMVLFEDSFVRIVSITFTALIFTELITVWTEMHNPWQSKLFLLSELVSICIYVVSFWVLDTFDKKYISQFDFWWRTLVISAVSCVPPVVMKYLDHYVWEPKARKIRRAPEHQQWGLSM
eukprot:TRINITY_DN1683_c5_g1_i1.p1 TRINITY_DN1683_c5_g1~~TRINITY_DN1683_c5_g1_i1.p1  ORF type:complete len:1293 (+),score=436.82 TRINITY_DN1683_c5_g1_i1:72-3881(+)